MNASADSHEDNGVCGSDSDSNADDSSDYYQPISSVDNGAEDSDDTAGEGDLSDRDPNSTFHQLPNGWLENGVSSLDISDDDDDAEKEVEEATESERAIERAFREDEARRNAPLTAENTGRVMDAMRQISFGGGAPDWAGQIPEDQWIDRLRRLRPPSSAASAPIDH
ncbi:uncharacterized protein LOC125200960 [Salvia hispanica]|uniref:uncharacterized protein LOC125200960 n=1 Tax=Salvia hispanica TaxID=49212 RepID=UPI002009A8B3|nr:uncharacterized protein LOC125200960 [Salvia hispanica]